MSETRTAEEEEGFVLVANSFHPLMARGDELARWAHDVRTSILDRLSGPTLLTRGEQSNRTPAIPASEWGESGEAKYFLDVRAWNRARSMPIAELSEDAWQAALLRLRQGDVENLQLLFERLDAHGYPNHALGTASLVIDIAPPASDWAHEIAVVVSLPLFGGRVPVEAQRAFIAALRAAAHGLHLAAGYLTVDADSRPYESRFRINPLEGRARCHDHVRGYYWGNVLTAPHVSQLGGVARVASEAPCFSVERWHSGTAYLQLTPDVNQIADDELASLRSYLGPLLLPARAVRYNGPPLRVLD